MAGRRPLFTQDQMRDMARLYVEGWSEAQISDRYGVCRDTVQRYLQAQGVQKRGHQEGREAARKSGWHAWRLERRASFASPFSQQVGVRQ